MIKPSKALRCLAYFAVQNAGSDALAIYDALEVVAGVLCVAIHGEEERIELTKLEVAAADAAAAIRKADDLQLEFMEFLGSKDGQNPTGGNGK